MAHAHTARRWERPEAIVDAKCPEFLAMSPHTVRKFHFPLYCVVILSNLDSENYIPVIVKGKICHDDCSISTNYILLFLSEEVSAF